MNDALIHVTLGMGISVLIVGLILLVLRIRQTIAERRLTSDMAMMARNILDKPGKIPYKKDKKDA